ncbi:MAG: hypothetical protein KF865_14310, partial [Bdellovibrionaceae bacterium]|nr:hypothetical protein [Pseudobdellovibrionaceae bacterium]
WPTAGSAAQSYRIYRVTAGQRVLITTVGPSATTYIDGSTYWGQIYNYQVNLVDQLGLEDSNTKVVSALAWGGISSVTTTSRTSLQVNFVSPTPLVDQVRVYIEPDNGSGVKTLVATLTGNDVTYTITGLRTGYKYKVSAQAYVASLNKEDGNTVTFPAVTNTEGYHVEGPSPFAYRNVLNIRAFGDSAGAPVSSISALRTPNARQVEVIWYSFYGKASPSTEYVLIRAAEGRTIDTSVTNSCTIASQDSCRVCRVSGTGVLMCRDTQIAASPARYEYAIALVQKSGGDEWVEPLPVDNSFGYFKLLVPIPPSHMVLVQRDAANHEICLTMGSPSDPSHHNRCAYLGIGAVPYSTGHNKPPLVFDAGYYDFGYNLFVDRYERSCNWTSQADGGKCGAGGTDGDCIHDTGAAPAGTIGKIGDTFYDAGTGLCYLKSSDSTWSRSWENSPTSLLKNSTNQNVGSKFLPALGGLTVYGAAATCSAVTDPVYGQFRLPRMREKQVFLAWPTETDDPYYLSNWAAIEHGSTAVSSRCIVSAAALGAAPADLSTLVSENRSAQTNTANVAAAVIGSAISADCQSRYGVQDGIGSKGESTNDAISTLLTTAPDVRTYVGGFSYFDNGNRDLNGIRFDGDFAAGGSSFVVGTTYTFQDTRVNTLAVTLGLPLVTTSNIYTPRNNINTNSDAFLPFNSTYMSNYSPYSRTFLYGGTGQNSTNAGRWFLVYAYPPDRQSSDYGFRCVLPAE